MKTNEELKKMSLQDLVLERIPYKSYCKKIEALIRIYSEDYY